MNFKNNKKESNLKTQLTKVKYKNNFNLKFFNYNKIN